MFNACWECISLAGVNFPEVWLWQRWEGGEGDAVAIFSCTISRNLIVLWITSIASDNRQAVERTGRYRTPTPVWEAVWIISCLPAGLWGLEAPDGWMEVLSDCRSLFYDSFRLYRCCGTSRAQNIDKTTWSHMTLPTESTVYHPGSLSWWNLNFKSWFIAIIFFTEFGLTQSFWALICQFLSKCCTCMWECQPQIPYQAGGRSAAQCKAVCRSLCRW